jgi:hypothetical protein
MLDSPGHKAGSGRRYAGGPGPNASSRGREAGARSSGVRRPDAGGRAGDPGPGSSPGRESGGRGREAAARGPARGRQTPPGAPLPWWGSRPGRLGIALVIGGAAVGLLGTVLTGSDPGAVLGIFLLAGTAAGALAVRPRAAYLIIPVPPLAYVVAATLAGLVHDHATDTSHTALAISAAQWIASGFLAMTAATLLAIVVATVRWAAARRREWGQRRPVIR